MSGLPVPVQPAPVGDEKYPFLIYSDVATFLAAGMESKIYTGKLDLKSVGMYGLVGIVSRYVEKFIATQNVNERFITVNKKINSLCL